jgi:hypothetical protein
MQQIEKYFTGETAQCMVGIFIAVISVGVAFYFLHVGKPLLKGIAYPLILISLLLLIICAGVVWRTPSDIKRVSGFYQAAPEKIKTDEIPRMEKVMTSFKMIKRVEMVLGVAGILMFIFFRKNDLMMGIGIGLTVEAVIMLSFDLVAEDRGKIYLDFLKSL